MTLSRLRLIGPIMILLWIALSAWRIGPKVRSEPMRPAWVQVIQEAVPEKEPSRPKALLEGALLEGTIDIGTAYRLGDPINLTLAATNKGEEALSDVVIWLPLPEGTNTVQGSRFLRFTKSELKPGESFRQKGTLVPTLAGIVKLEPRFISNESEDVRLPTDVKISTAVLSIEPEFKEAWIGTDQAMLCFRVTNHGGAPARDLILRLYDVSDEILFWPEVEPGDSVEACFDLSGLAAGEYDFVAEASAYAADLAFYRNRLVVE